MKNKKVDNDLINIISNEGEPEDEFIVGIDFCYCDVTYSGYQIVDRSTVKILWDELQKDRLVYTPNMPGSWEEDYDISLLQDAFSIHSDNPDDINSMRNLFGDSVGNTDLLSMVLDSGDESDEGNESADNIFYGLEIITKEAAEVFVNHPEPEEWMVGAPRGITLDAAKIIVRFQGSDLYFECLQSEYLTEDVAKTLAEFGGASLGFGNDADECVWDITPEVARALSLFKGDELFFNGHTILSFPAAQALSKFAGDIYLLLVELPDDTAEALAQHSGDLVISKLKGELELSDSAVRSLAKKRGKIDSMPPKEWVDSLPT